MVMEVLYINHHENIEIEENCMALGYFDGLHLGHQKLLDTVTKIAQEQGLKKALMTFDKHPKELFDKVQYPYLSTLQDKIALLEEYEFDYVIIVHFDESFSKLQPEEFIQRYIVEGNVKHVVCGFDYRFGYKGKGDTKLLLEEAKQRYEVTIAKEEMYQEHKISSTHIKSLLQSGDIQTANKLLGRQYPISGEVVYGYQRGKKELGFPTANTEYNGYIIPQIGVYGVHVWVKGKMYYGMANIGFNPTFGDLKKPSLEVHIFDFDEDIYGEVITVYFEMHKRGEKKFSSIKELIHQLHKDQQDIKMYFAQAHC